MFICFGKTLPPAAAPPHDRAALSSEQQPWRISSCRRRARWHAGCRSSVLLSPRRQRRRRRRRRRRTRCVPAADWISVALVGVIAVVVAHRRKRRHWHVLPSFTNNMPARTPGHKTVPGRACSEYHRQGARSDDCGGRGAQTGRIRCHCRRGRSCDARVSATQVRSFHTASRMHGRQFERLATEGGSGGGETYSNWCLVLPVRVVSPNRSGRPKSWRRWHSQ